MSTETLEAGEMFAARTVEYAKNPEMGCAHRAFPEVGESGWLPDFLNEALSVIVGIGTGALPVQEDPVADIAHILWVVAAGGMAAGRADASQTLGDVITLTSLEDIDWDNLPELGSE